MALRAGVIALVPDQWGLHWMGRHEVLTRLSRHLPTVWVDPAPGWRDAWRLSPPRGHPVQLPEATHSGGDFVVYRGRPWLPQMYRPAAAGRFTQRRRLEAARRLLRDRGCRAIVLFLLRPEFAYALDLLEHDVSCYAIRDEYSFAPVERPIDPDEANLIARVDQVFITSTMMFQRKGALNPNTLRIPNGVDYGAFATPVAEPADLRQISRPRIAYIGWIKEQIDLQLLQTLARTHREWSFVLVGPTRATGDDANLLAALRALPNVHLLGVRPHTALPGYFQHVDVTVMPYRLNDYTKYIDPLKLMQGLASGRPVVSAGIPAVEDLTDVVDVATTAEEWSAALAAALSPAAMTAERVARRRAIARSRDWDALVARLVSEIQERLASHATAALTS